MTIRRHGWRPPFFGMPGNSEAPSFPPTFRVLAQRLGSDQPFYRYQPQDQDGERTNLLDIENMAVIYVREVRALQPEGLYFLGSHSSGCPVAFEMARQPRSQGRDVAPPILFDTELRAKVPLQRRLRLQSCCKRREGLLGYVPRTAKSNLWTIAYGVWLRFGPTRAESRCSGLRSPGKRTVVIPI